MPFLKNHRRFHFGWQKKGTKGSLNHGEDYFKCLVALNPPPNLHIMSKIRRFSGLESTMIYSWICFCHTVQFFLKSWSLSVDIINVSQGQTTRKGETQNHWPTSRMRGQGGRVTWQAQLHQIRQLRSPHQLFHVSSKKSGISIFGFDAP